MVSPVSGDSPINYSNPVDQTAAEEEVAETQDDQNTPPTNPPPTDNTPDESAVKYDPNAAAREILERFNPDEIAYAIKVNPSGQGSGATNPFELFNAMGSGGSSPGGPSGP